MAQKSVDVKNKEVGRSDAAEGVTNHDKFFLSGVLSLFNRSITYQQMIAHEFTIFKGKRKGS